MRRWLACFIVASGFVGCNSPTAPEGRRDCRQASECIERLADAPLNASEEAGQLAKARSRAEQAIGRAIVTPNPVVRYVKCAFYVENAKGYADGVCACGVTVAKAGYVKVATGGTCGGERVAALVEWEGFNYFVSQNGRGDLAW